MKKVVCFMLAIIMMLSMTVTAFAAGNNNSENAPHIDPIFDLVDEISTTAESLSITDVYTDKAAYSPGSAAIITVQLTNSANITLSDTVNFDVYRLESCIFTDSRTFSVNANETSKISYTWNCPASDYTGYPYLTVSILNPAKG